MGLGGFGSGASEVIAVPLSSVFDHETTGGFSSGSNDMDFPSGNETDPHAWKQADNKTYKVPAGKAGRYLVVVNAQGEQADANSTFILQIWLNSVLVAANNDDRDNAGAARYGSLSRILNLVEGDVITVTYFATDSMGTTDLQTLDIQQIAVAQPG